MKKFFQNFLVFTLLLFLLFSLTRTLFEYKKKYDFYLSFKKEYEELVKKNRKLKTEILKNKDSFLIEKNIREKLNLLRPNEIAVILPKITPTPTPTPTPSSFFLKIKNMIKNIFSQ